MKQVYQAYYTNCQDITGYMVHQLQLKQKDIVLEPGGGTGLFIDALLAKQPDCQIDTYDIDRGAVRKMRKKYHHLSGVTVTNSNLLTNRTLDRYQRAGGRYDKVIGNPPYGAWLEYSQREELKNKYGEFYSSESYALFLFRCITLLKEGGRLSFILPDTFLFLHAFETLRKFLLTKTEINEIVLFPSNFFPGTSFGYSNLCIITLTKRCALERLEGNKSNTMKIITDLTKVEDLTALTKGKHKDFTLISLPQQEVLKNINATFLLEQNIADAVNNSKFTVGDLADCVTGLYTGNNKKWLTVKDHSVRGGKSYPIVAENKIYSHWQSLAPVPEQGAFLPMVKGSPPAQYHREIRWFVQWDTAALAYYTGDKKARFQNTDYYFRKGIALPMIKSRQIKATLMQEMVFDQSIVGIFPKDEKYLYYLLGYLNSSTAGTFIHHINPTANNSANYIKKIPIALPSDQLLEQVTTAVKKILQLYETKAPDKKKLEELEAQVDTLFSQQENI